MYILLLMCLLYIHRCVGISDEGIALLVELHEQLEGLTIFLAQKRITVYIKKNPGISLLGLNQITDNGVLPLARACKSLSIINLNLCCNITDVTIETFARNSRQLQVYKKFSILAFNDVCINRLSM